MDSKRLLDTFLDLVRIDSPSKSEAAVAQYCTDVLEGLGCTVKIDDTAPATGSDTGNLIATLPGTGPGKIIFSAHMDSVDPCIGIEPVVESGVIRSSGDTILGGDDKVGIASALETLRSVLEAGGTYPTISMVFTVQEEVGLVGAKHLDPADAQCDLCLVLDADGDPGTSIIGAPFSYSFDATFTGVAAHAGVNPEKGISAIRMAASAIESMELGRLDEKTTANVGTVAGGSANNVISETCTITGECRSLSAERILEVKEQITTSLTSAAEKFGGSVDVDWVLDFDGFEHDEESPEVLSVREIARSLGLPDSTSFSGGGSDANILAGKGVKVLVLGTGMTDVHSTKETVKVSDLEDLTRFLVAITTSFSPFIS